MEGKQEQEQLQEQEQEEQGGGREVEERYEVEEAVEQE